MLLTVSRYDYDVFSFEEKSLDYVLTTYFGAYPKLNKKLNNYFHKQFKLTVNLPDYGLDSLVYRELSELKPHRKNASNKELRDFVNTFIQDHYFKIPEKKSLIEFLEDNYHDDSNLIYASEENKYLNDLMLKVIKTNPDMFGIEDYDSSFEEVSCLNHVNGRICSSKKVKKYINEHVSYFKGTTSELTSSDLILYNNKKTSVFEIKVINKRLHKKRLEQILKQLTLQAEFYENNFDHNFEYLGVMLIKNLDSYDIVFDKYKYDFKQKKLLNYSKTKNINNFDIYQYD